MTDESTHFEASTHPVRVKENTRMSEVFTKKCKILDEMFIFGRLDHFYKTNPVFESVVKLRERWENRNL